MPSLQQLETDILSLQTLAGAVFGVGIIVAIGRIGWKVAKRYFFAGSSASAREWKDKSQNV